MNVYAKLAKYTAIGRITVSNQLAYAIDLVVRSLFLLVILYIFVQLWTVTFAGVGQTVIAGYTFEQIIWYLIVSESIIMASPRVTVEVEEEVKSGSVAYMLTRPMHYIGYRYAAYVGEASVRLAVNLLMGGLLGLLLFGPPSFGWGPAVFVPVVVLAFTVNFVIRLTLALCSFWIEETLGLTFVYDKLLFTIGGMMLPMELFPDALRAVCAWLPFQAIVYFPAKTMVQLDADAALRMLGTQAAWLLPLGLLLAFVYRKGVKKLNVNGG